MSIHNLVLLLVLQQGVTKGPHRPGDFGDDLTASEISEVLYMAISCAQGDRVVLLDYDPDRVTRALTSYWEDLSRAKTPQEAQEALKDYLYDLKWSKLKTPMKVFTDALTEKQRPWPYYCDKDNMYSDGGSRYQKWYTPAILAEYGQAMWATGRKWKVPVTGLLLQGITESNMMHLLSQGNCRPVKNTDGTYQINPRTLAPLCEAPVKPGKNAWTEGQPGIDYGAWQVAYSVATRGLTKQQRKDWVRQVSTVAGAADIAGKWWHRSSNGQCNSAVAESRWRRTCGERPEFKYLPGETSEEGNKRWRKAVSYYLFCNSCRGSYKLFGSAIAYAGRKYEPSSAAMDMWENRIEPALRKVREKRQWGFLMYPPSPVFIVE